MFCIPIISSDTEEAIQKIRKAEPSADIFEVRLDLMDNFDLRRIINSSRRPLIITYRSETEGGSGTADPETIADYLVKGAKAGANYVDVEFSMAPSWRNKILSSIDKNRVIISTHINDRTPPRKELFDIFRKSTETGAGIIKIVTLAHNWEDNLRILELIPAAKEKNIKIIAFCMGSKGKISRIMSILMGSFIGFSSIKEGEESASGQIPISEMKRFLEYFTSC